MREDPERGKRKCCECRGGKCSGAWDPPENSNGEGLGTLSNSSDGEDGAGSSSGDGRSESNAIETVIRDGGGFDIANRESVVEPDASVDVPAPPAVDPTMPVDGPEVHGAEPIYPAVPAGGPVTTSEGPEQPNAEPASEPAVPPLPRLLQHVLRVGRWQHTTGTRTLHIVPLTARELRPAV